MTATNSAPRLHDLSWSPWVPLEGARSDAAVPKLPGLYRIR
jgi:hypothetical protein